MLPRSQPTPTNADLYKQVAAGPKSVKNVVHILPRIVSKEMFTGCPNGWFLGWADFLLHVGVWIMVIVFDTQVFMKADKWNKPTVDASGAAVAAADTITYPYALAGLVLTWISFGHILLLLVYHRLVDLIVTELAPFILAIIMGAIRASFVMTLIYTLFTTSPATASDEWKIWTITLLVGKTFLLSILTHNTDEMPKTEAA
jgi:hypothetical protein